MAIDYTYGIEQGWLRSPTPPEQEDSQPFALENRGTWMDLISSGARGVAGATEQVGYGLEQLGVENPLPEVVKEVRKDYDILKPDIAEFYGDEGAVTRGLKSIPESVITSLGATVPGAIAGFKVGGTTGAVWGAGANMALTMGLGIYGKAKEDYLAKNPGDEQGAVEYALLQSGAELGLETASNVFALATFGGSKILTEAGKVGAKTVARNLLSMSGKEIAKDILKVGGVELGTELATYVVQSSADERYSMGEGPTLEGGIETAVSTLGMSFIFASAGTKYNYDQKKQLKSWLKSDNPDAQAKAATLIKLDLEKSGDTDLAQAWEDYTSSHIRNGLPIGLNDEFVSLAEKINNVNVSISDIANSNPDIQKHAVDKILKEANINEDGSISTTVTPDDMENIFFGREALDYNKTRNLGTKETRRQREILEGRQEVERREAERTPSVTLEDPIKTLERLYQEQEYQAYDPTDTENYNFRRDLFEAKGEMDALAQDDLRYAQEARDQEFLDVAAQYTKDKNQVRTIADLLQSPDDQVKLKMLEMMNQLEKDSSNVRPEVLEQMKQEVQTIANQKSSEGDTRLEEYLKKKEASRVRQTTGDLGRVLTDEEKVQLAKAKIVVRKGIKGSKQVKQAQDTVAKLEAITQTPVIPTVEPTPSRVDIQDNPEVYTPKDIEDKGVGTGTEEVGEGGFRPVAATLTTPEDIVQRKEAIQQNPELDVNQQEIDDADTFLSYKAEELKDPVLKALVRRGYQSIPDMLKDSKGKLVKKEQLADALVRNHIAKLGNENILQYETYIGNLIREFNDSVNTQRVNEVEGAKESDAIEWEPKENRAQVQHGVHKDLSDLKVEIHKLPNNMFELRVDKEVKEVVKGRVAARQAFEKYVPPRQQETKPTTIRRRRGVVVKPGEQTVNEIITGATPKVQEEVLEGAETTLTEVEDTTSPSGPASEVKILSKEKFKVIKDAQGRTRVVPVEEEITSEANNQYLDPPEFEAKTVEKALEGKSLLEVNQWIIDNAPDASYKEIARKTKIVLQQFKTAGATLEFNIGHLGKLVPGTLLQSRGISTSSMKDKLSVSVWVNGSDVTGKVGTSYETVLHELVHAASQAALFLGSRKVAQGTKLAKATSDLIAVSNQIIQHFNKRVREAQNGGTPLTTFEERVYQGMNNAFKDQHEILAWTFTNKQMQKYLESIKINKKQSLLSKFVTTIRSLLGLTPENDTALTEVIRLGEEIFNTPVDQITSMIDAVNGRTTMAAQVDAFTVSSEQVETAQQYKTKAFLDKELKKVISRIDEPNRKEGLLDFYKKFEIGLSKGTQKLYDAAHEISPLVAEKLRKLDEQVNKITKRRAGLTTPFSEKLRKMSKHGRETINFYLLNLENPEARDLLMKKLQKFSTDPKTPNLIQDFENIRKMLDEVQNEAEMVGLLKEKRIEGYFPNRVKDIDGLVAYLRNRDYYKKAEKFISEKKYTDLKEYLQKNDLYEGVSDLVEGKDYSTLLTYLKDRYDWGTFDEAIAEAQDKATKEKREFTDADRAEVIGKIIATGRRPSAYLRTPAGVKKRSIHRINADMSKFYYTPMEAVGMHIREMTERIEINKMLGVTQNQDLQTKLAKLQDQYQVEQDPAKKEKMSDEIDLLISRIPTIDQLIDDGIGKIIAEEVKKRNITEYEQRRIKDIIRARITQRGAGKIVSGIRQAALLGSLTQLGTGLRNISDVINFMYSYGELNTFKAMISVATGNKLSKNVEFDFYQPLKEFSTINRFVDKAVKMSGMIHIDKFFKDVGMEAAFMKAQKMDQEAFVKEWEKAFGKEGAAQVYKDIQEGKITEDVEYYLYSSIANYQPVGLSEMPEWFNRAGNGRIFYLLKSYSLSMANNFYRETIKKIRNGEVKQGLTNLAHLGTLFLLAGASTDWLVDWINGKNPDFTESMIDTFLTLGLMSRYSLDKGTKEGYVKALTSNILPPTGLLDYPLKSVVSLFKPEDKFDWEFLRLTPMVGAVLYGQVTSTGVEKSINDSKRRLYEEIRDTGKVDYEKVREINRRVRDFNTGIKPTEKLQQITPGTISAQRKKGLKEQQGV